MAVLRTTEHGFVIPSSAREAFSSHGLAAEIPDTSPLRILVADDDVAFQELIDLHLTVLADGVSHAITHCETGEQAVELLRKAQERSTLFDLLLLDVYMKKDGINGLQVAHVAQEINPHGFVALYSSNAPELKRDIPQETLLQSGVHTILRKDDFPGIASLIGQTRQHKKTIVEPRK